MTDTEHKADIQDELDLVLMYPNVEDETEPVAKYHGKPVYLQFPNRDDGDLYKGMPIRARVADLAKDGVMRAIVVEVYDD